MWQLWQASLSTCSFSLGLSWGARPWHDSQLAREKSVWPGTSIPRVSRALAWYRLPDTAWPMVVWQSEQPKFRPSEDICTSSSFGGLISEESRSPCFKIGRASCRERGEE